MKSVARHQFIYAFNNEGGDFAFQFDNRSTRMTVPWHDIIPVSQTIMVFGYPFDQIRSFMYLFRKMKLQHLHHIFRQFALEYNGDLRAWSMLFIKYQQVRLDAVASELMQDKRGSSASVIFDNLTFKTDAAQQF
jgi:hypothetical protein